MKATAIPEPGTPVTTRSFRAPLQALVLLQGMPK